MPNHIKNIVDFSDFSTNQFKKIQDEICGDEILDDGEKRLFDFLKIIPAPDHLIYPLEDYASTKHPLNWYNWNREHWGTKWNSYDLSDWKKQRISFYTAWNMPDPIFKALSLKYPKSKIEVSFADEDIGRNCGMAIYRAGVRINYFEWDNHSYMACKFARMVRGAK